MIRFYLEPKVVIEWKDFINLKPDFSLALNKAEGLFTQENRWGGSSIIGGSPRKTGSRLSPKKLEKVINDCIKLEENQV